jgi:hypothetical protein
MMGTKEMRIPRSLAFGIISPPSLYLAAYFAFRLSGVFHLFYNQGGWEMDGSTGVTVIDIAFAPIAMAELDFENRVHVLREPSGG